MRASQISFIRSGNDATLIIAPSAEGGSDGGSVKLLNILTNGQNGIETIKLADGSWSAEQLRAKVVAASATSGNDYIPGFSTADSLAGGAGDDTLEGADGNDSYFWTRGDGSDVIIETGSVGGSADILTLAGVRAAQVSFSRSGTDATLIIAPSAADGTDGGSVKLIDLNPNGESGVETVKLDDATWTADQLRAKIIAAAATAGNDRINGFDGADTIFGGAGADILSGLAGIA